MKLKSEMKLLQQKKLASKENTGYYRAEIFTDWLLQLAGMYKIRAAVSEVK